MDSDNNNDLGKISVSTFAIANCNFNSLSGLTRYLIVAMLLLAIFTSVLYSTF